MENLKLELNFESRKFLIRNRLYKLLPKKVGNLLKKLFIFNNNLSLIIALGWKLLRWKPVMDSMWVKSINPSKIPSFNTTAIYIPNYSSF